MKDERHLERRVRAFVEQSCPQLIGSDAVIAVSGGGDSIAAAALLVEAGVLTASRCVVAHFDHRLRHEDAARLDLAAVEALCAQYGFELATGAWDTPVPREAWAREARYRFLAGVVRARGPGCIVVTGHTADDQVETVLMNIIRGAGVHGLGGMRSVSRVPVDRSDVPLVRPLLCLSHAEVRGYAAARNIEFVDDATNDDRSFLRNRVRHEFLPAIELDSRNVRRSILQLASDAQAQSAALDAIGAGAFVDTLLDGTPPRVVLSRTVLAAMPAAVVPHVFRVAVSQLLGDARELGRRHYEMLCGIARARTGATFELPRSVRVTVDPHEVILSIGEMATLTIPPDIEYPIPWRGDLGAWHVEVERTAGGLPSSADRVPVDAAMSLPSDAVVRGRRPGDQMFPGAGHSGSKLKKAYNAWKVPRRERDAAPVIAAGRTVLWTPFGSAPAADGGMQHIVRAAPRPCDP